MDSEFSLNDFPTEFVYDIDNKDSNISKKCVLIRANLQNKEDCERWLKAYESKTRTKWIVAKVMTTPFRYDRSFLSVFCLYIYRQNSKMSS
jgi:exoribonuclease II